MNESQFVTHWQVVRLAADDVILLKIAQTRNEAAALAAAHPGSVAVFRPVRLPPRFEEPF